MNYRNLNDNEMLYMVSDNNEDLLGYIYEKYKPVVLGIAKKYYKYSRNTIIDFEDVVQSGFYALSNAIKQYDVNNGATFYTFALKCIKNAIIKIVSRSNEKFVKDNTYYHSIYDSIYHISDCNYNRDSFFSNEELNQFSLELDFDYSLVFILRMNGFTYKEISHLLDMKYKKVDYIIQKCKNKLKKSLFV